MCVCMCVYLPQCGLDGVLVELDDLFEWNRKCNYVMCVWVCGVVYSPLTSLFETKILVDFGLIAC